MNSSYSFSLYVRKKKRGKKKKERKKRKKKKRRKNQNEDHLETLNAKLNPERLQIASTDRKRYSGKILGKSFN